MDKILNIVNDTSTCVRVYLLKKNGYKGCYNAVLFPNEPNFQIKESYAQNVENFCKGRTINEYDGVHSEKCAIEQLPLSELTFWKGMLEAIFKADKENLHLDKKNFCDSYSVIVLVYEHVSNGKIDTVYLIAQYRKIESWYKRSLMFAFTTNVTKFMSDDIFVLNGCVDTAIVDDTVFILQEKNFEKIFNHYQKSVGILKAHKENIKSWKFIDRPTAFYDSVEGRKGATRKLARALEKSGKEIEQLQPPRVREVLSQYDVFDVLEYDENDRIVFSHSSRDLIIDILRQTYTRQLFSNNIVQTKGV